MGNLFGENRRGCGADGAARAHGTGCSAEEGAGAGEKSADAQAAALLGCLSRRTIQRGDGSGYGRGFRGAGGDWRGFDALSRGISHSSEGEKAFGTTAGNGAGEAAAGLRNGGGAGVWDAAETARAGEIERTRQPARNFQPEARGAD